MVDLVLLAIIGVSGLLGLLRGFVAIVVSTTAWLLAGWAAFQFGADTAGWLAEGAAPDMSHLLGGYALTFVGVLLTIYVLGMLLKSAVDATRLNGVDRSLGLALGVLRGAFIACVLILVMGFTPLPRERAWQESLLLPVLQPGANWMRAQLPDWSLPELPAMPALELPGALPELRNSAGSGDNGGHEVLPIPLMEQGKALVSGGRSASAGGPASLRGPVLPANLERAERAGADPAQVRPEAHDPANVDASGQAGPASH